MRSAVHETPIWPERGAAQAQIPDLIRSLSPADVYRSPELTLAAGSQRAGTLTRDQVMTANEVADLVHLPVSTVYKLARRGKLPASRFGRTWRFLRPRIEEMLRA